MIPVVAEKKAVRLSAVKAVPVRIIRARFDAAETTDNNRRHWAWADGLSADAAATPLVRYNLRTRCRYEVKNNSYARGIVLTIANDTVGTGPRLQMLTSDDSFNRQVEKDFHQWAQAIGLAEKLRTMRMARCQDGEAFAVLATNPRVDHPVCLDVKPVEADQITSPWQKAFDPTEVDGIRLDRFGNPVSYRMLKYHPGDTSFYQDDEAVEIPAAAMVHVFRSDRPGQHRGTPEIGPAIELFAQLRRFTLAVLSAAESAANVSGILYTDSPANGEADSVEPMDRIELERNMLLTMPGGWKMGQVEPQQPATTYAEFKKEILNEIARCLNMPFNIAAGNSSGYNYASGRLDHQTYYKSIRVDQAFMANQVLDRILRVWLWEYALEMGLAAIAWAMRQGCLSAYGLELAANSYSPDSFSFGYPGTPQTQGLPSHQWFWDGVEHVDPSKEANAQETRLKNHTTTLAIEYARQGRDWEMEIRQRAREQNLMRELGLTENDSLPKSKPEKLDEDTDELDEE